MTDTVVHAASVAEATREQLRQLLKQRGILYSTAREPILQRDGRLAPWAFYSWQLTQTAEGLRLVALNLLERLRTFESRQIASYGYTAMPLVSACVLLGEGRYTGLCVRERRKTYLARRLVDGPVDRSAPVVVIDDSLSSGRSLSHAIHALESDGFRVEGTIALVHFSGRGGAEWARSMGYRVETLFDVWTDLEMKSIVEPAAPAEQMPDGLHPAVLARHAARAYVTHGRTPRSPRSLDGEYDARGGVFVSFRHRETDVRVGRDGFWRFPADQAADPARDVVAATQRTLQRMGRLSPAALERLKIAVTFFGPLTPVKPAELDFDRFGIVVRSDLDSRRVGGALPNTEVFTSEVEQYAHARMTNARLAPNEPHTIYRHEVHKVAEPGVSWPPYGQPDGPETAWTRDQELGAQLTHRARQAVLAFVEGGEPQSEPVRDHLVPETAEALAVTLYRNGFLAYGLAERSAQTGLDACLLQAVRRALADRRLTGAQDLSEVAIVVSVLHDAERLGIAGPDGVAMKVRRGLDSLRVSDGRRSATSLATCIPYNNWLPDEFVARTLAASGAAEGRARWTTLKTASWLRNHKSVSRLEYGFPVRSPIHDYDFSHSARDIELLAGFLLANSGPDGLPAYYLEPVRGARVGPTWTGRTLHALLNLDSAGQLLGRDVWREVARRGLTTALARIDMGGSVGGALADCTLLAAVPALSPEVASIYSGAIRRLAARVADMFRADGRICQDVSDPLVDHIFLPGAALWATGTYLAHSGGEPLPRLGAQLDYYRRQFRALPSWGSMGWQAQGWAAMYALTAEQAQADFVFEVADWALDRQLEKNGAFLEDLTPYGPGFNTGFITEGLAAAWRTARSAGDRARAERYGASWRAAVGFLRRLMIMPEDTFCMPLPEESVGGVRCSLWRSDVRVDFVSHALHALVEGARCQRDEMAATGG